MKFCIALTILYIVWCSGYIAEHTPVKSWWDTFVVLAGIFFAGWFSLIFMLRVLG